MSETRSDLSDFPTAQRLAIDCICTYNPPLDIQNFRQLRVSMRAHVIRHIKTMVPADYESLLEETMSAEIPYPDPMQRYCKEEKSQRFFLMQLMLLGVIWELLQQEREIIARRGMPFFDHSQQSSLSH